MIIEISCPQCGYNEYRALNTTTQKEVTIRISKCEIGCELEIPEEEIFETHKDFKDLLLDSRYKILEQTSSNCITEE